MWSASEVADTLAIAAPPYFDRDVWHEMLRWRLAERGGLNGGRAGAAPLNLSAELCALLQSWGLQTLD